MNEKQENGCVEERKQMLPICEKEVTSLSPKEVEVLLKNPADQKIRYLVTALICTSFLCLGLCDAVVGPTLLDLKELYKTDLDKISLIVFLRSIGSLGGTFLAGYLLDRFSDKRCYILFIYCLGFGLFTGFTPWMGNIVALLAISFLYGLHSSSVDAGGNVLLLDSWRGLDSGPYMHSIHFAFGTGAFLAPVLAEPFLNEKPSSHFVKAFEDNSTANGNGTTNELQDEADVTEYKIRILYPIIGLITIVVALGYLYFGITNPKVIRGKEKKDPDAATVEKTSEQKDKKILKLIFVVLMCLFFLLYVGMEVCFGLYIATFAVECQLNLSKSEGAFITAIFWGCFAAARFSAIFAAVKLQPIYIMLLSFGFCLVGAFPLAIWAEKSALVLKVCSGCLGIGMASVFASGFLWTEQFITVSNRIGAAFTIASSTGADIFPLLLGQTIGHFPMLIMYLQLGIILTCISLFLGTVFVGRKILESNTTKTDEDCKL